jgi:hypothetical protein
MAKPSKEKQEAEIVPDAWERFERAVDAAIKSGPKHRAAKKKTATKKTKSSKKQT